MPTKRCVLFVASLLSISHSCFSQQPSISTIDIDNFWRAYDKLHTAGSRDDSLAIIQTEYIDRASHHFRTFIRLRNFTAAEYVKIIGSYPKFWNSVRPRTENIAERSDEIEAILKKFKNELPDFKIPDVCFAIGCLRTGGTTGNTLILIGSEIAAADSTVAREELSPWLKMVIGNTGDIAAMVAHEAVHTRQSGLILHRNLVKQSIKEGVADFIAMEITGLGINARVHAYGKAHACELRTEFNRDVAKNNRDYSKWLYNGSQTSDRPADLGYYIGYTIAEEFYTRQQDKIRAMKWLLNTAKYKKIYVKSGFRQSCKY